MRSRLLVSCVIWGLLAAAVVAETPSESPSDAVAAMIELAEKGDMDVLARTRTASVVMDKQGAPPDKQAAFREQRTRFMALHKDRLLEALRVVKRKIDDETDHAVKDLMVNATTINFRVDRPPYNGIMLRRENDRWKFAPWTETKIDKDGREQYVWDERLPNEVDPPVEDRLKIFGLDDNDPKAQLAAMQGTWRTFSEFRDGEQVAFDLESKVVIEGDRMTWVQPGGDRLTCRLEVDPTKTPKQVDLVILDGLTAGRTMPGIYQWDGGLVLCFREDPLGGRPSSFEIPDDKGLTRLVLVRDQ